MATATRTLRQPPRKAAVAKKLTRPSPQSFTEAMSPLSLRLTQQQLSGLASLRESTGIRQNELIRRALDEFLKRELK